MSDENPMSFDSHGHSVPAWTGDVLNLNLRVVDWISLYYDEQRTLASNVLHASHEIEKNDSRMANRTR